MLIGLQGNSRVVDPENVHYFSRKNLSLIWHLIDPNKYKDILGGSKAIIVGTILTILEIEMPYYRQIFPGSKIDGIPTRLEQPIMYGSHMNTDLCVVYTSVNTVNQLNLVAIKFGGFTTFLVIIGVFPYIILFNFCPNAKSAKER